MEHKSNLLQNGLIAVGLIAVKIRLNSKLLKYIKFRNVTHFEILIIQTNESYSVAQA